MNLLPLSLDEYPLQKPRPMILTAIILCILFLFPSFGGAVSHEAPVTIQAKVNGLVCEMCALTLKKTFEEKTPIKDISVDIDSKIVTFVFTKDPELTEESLKTLIEKAGYSLEELLPQEAATRSS